MFALGALLVVGGLAALGRRLASSRVGVAGLLLSAAGMVFVVGSAYVEVYVAPVVGFHAMHRIEAASGLWQALTLVTYLLGPVLIAVAGLMHRTLSASACIAILLAQVVTAAGPPLIAPEGVTLIPATVVLGLSLAALGWAARGDAPGPSEP